MVCNYALQLGLLEWRKFGLRIRRTIPPRKCGQFKTLPELGPLAEKATTTPKLVQTGEHKRRAHGRIELSDLGTLGSILLPPSST